MGRLHRYTAEAQHGDDASKQYHCADVTTIQLKVGEHFKYDTTIF